MFCFYASLLCMSSVVYLAREKAVGKVEITESNGKVSSSLTASLKGFNDGPAGLAIDHATERLYWFDSKDKNSINSFKPTDKSIKKVRPVFLYHIKRLPNLFWVFIRTLFLVSAVLLPLPSVSQLSPGLMKAKTLILGLLIQHKQAPSQLSTQA